LGKHRCGAVSVSRRKQVGRGSPFGTYFIRLIDTVCYCYCCWGTSYSAVDSKKKSCGVAYIPGDRQNVVVVVVVVVGAWA
jgi:hypothetical protein